MKHLLTVTVLISLVACKEKSEDPPPIAQGKCVVDTFEGARATKQLCNWGGYSWSCRWMSTGRNDCDRTGESASERPADPAPVAQPSPAAAPADATPAD